MRNYHKKKLTAQRLYPLEPWYVSEQQPSADTNHRNESMFALGNGAMGVRGTFEEAYSGPAKTTTPGVYLNGIYTSEALMYPEEAPGLPRQGQTMLNVADWTGIELEASGERFDPLSSNVSEYRRSLDMKRGVLTRTLVWTTTQGARLHLQSERLVSFSRPSIGALRYRADVLEGSVALTFHTQLKGDVQQYHHLREKNVLNVETCDWLSAETLTGIITQRAKATSAKVAAAVRHQLGSNTETAGTRAEGGNLSASLGVRLQAGEHATLVKIAALTGSMTRELNELQEHVMRELEQAAEAGFDTLLEEQEAFLQAFWDAADITIDGDAALQQALRFSAFHLLQSTGRDGETNVAAKGLTGEFYEGHTFWDTEAYILPFFLHTQPEVAKQLLLFRYNTLEEARQNARRMKLKGALFPWRTINGHEASGYFMGATIQYHIDADIAYAVARYLSATGDTAFLFDYGAEILIETARMWASRGSFVPLRGGAFCLSNVCGPDEYQPGGNNNCYTNYLAKFNLETALGAVKQMQAEAPEKFAALKQKLELDDDELTLWREAAETMFLPYEETLGIHPQDDGFLYKDALDIDAIPEAEIPLVKHWHPLVIWRYQVLKQADVVLLMLLLSDKFSLEQKKANYDFYEPKTTHDSSLSPAIYSIIASEIGYREDAYAYFTQTARLDLDDYNDNAYQGLHIACLAGTWLTLVQGFAGMRVKDGALHFAPYVPEAWNGYSFRLQFQGRRLELRANASGTTYSLLQGEPLTVFEAGRAVRVS